MRTSRPFLILAILVAAQAQPAFAVEASPAGFLPAEPRGFTLALAMNRAMRENPTLVAARARVNQARLDRNAAGLWWARPFRAQANMDLGTPGGLATVTPDGTVMPRAVVGIGMSVADLLGGPTQVARADEAIIMAEADLKRTSLEIAGATATAFYDYAAAKQLAGLAGDMVDAAEADVRIAERNFARGAAAVNGLLAARLAVQRARVDGATSRGNVVRAWTSLLAVMGDRTLGDAGKADTAGR